MFNLQQAIAYQGWKFDLGRMRVIKRLKTTEYEVKKLTGLDSSVVHELLVKRFSDDSFNPVAITAVEKLAKWIYGNDKKWSDVARSLKSITKERFMYMKYKNFLNIDKKTATELEKITEGSVKTSDWNLT